jgi:hypothetical protein
MYDATVFALSFRGGNIDTIGQHTPPVGHESHDVVG